MLKNWLTDADSLNEENARKRTDESSAQPDRTCENRTR